MVAVTGLGEASCSRYEVVRSPEAVVVGGKDDGASEVIAHLLPVSSSALEIRGWNMAAQEEHLVEASCARLSME